MEDEVVREIDVVFANNLDLYLLQFPLKPWYSDRLINAQGVKFKRRHKKLEFDCPFPEGILTDRMVGDDDEEEDNTQTITSANIPSTVSLGVGVMKDDVLHVTPLQSIFQMRPSFRNMKGKHEIIESNMETEQFVKEEKPVVQLKRREGERASSKSQSFVHAQAKEDSEAWIGLRYYDMESNESNAEISRLY